MNLFIGNLSCDTSENELREAFEAYGDVESVHVTKNSSTSHSLVFASIDMPNPLQADAAVRALNLHSLRGRVMLVRQTRNACAGPPTRIYGRMN